MIDWDRFNELRTDIGEEDFAEVAELFTEEMSEMLGNLARRPNTATADDFHFLRGSALNLGFIDLAKACLERENTVKSGALPEVASLLEVFEESFAELQKAQPLLIKGAA